MKAIILCNSKFYFLQVVQNDEIKCPTCEKVCKSKGGLTRHQNAKHSSKKETFRKEINIDVLKSFLCDVKTSLSEDLNYPKCFRQLISTYDIDNSNLTKLCQDLEPVFNELTKKGDAENFFQSFYSIVMFNPTRYISLEQPHCTLLLKRLGDKLLKYFKEQDSVPILNALPMTEKEETGLQYLAGYVVKKLLSKARNSSKFKSNEIQFVICVLESMKTNDYIDQKLIHCQSRGGLTAINNTSQRIFKNVEMKFRQEISISYLRKINTISITQKLITDVDIVSLFNNVLEEANTEIDDEVSKNLLEKMIALYLRVRAFSTARDITTKGKLQSKTVKQKGLRNTIKKSSKNYIR